MELYILDHLVRRVDVVDNFESMIWTERWNSVGDFELDILSTLDNRSRLTAGTWLSMNRSRRIMKVEAVEDTLDSDGKQILRIKGQSLESILDDRVVANTLTDMLNETPWVLEGLPIQVARQMFNHICRAPAALFPEDVIPFIGQEWLVPTIEDPDPEDIISWEQPPDSLLTALREICTRYSLGFRLTHNHTPSQLVFRIFEGVDRTGRQTDWDPVIFSVNLDSLQSPTEFTTIQQAKNVAYVFSDRGTQIVYSAGADATTAGFERQVLLVTPSVPPEITGASNVNKFLRQKGREALRQHRGRTIFEGEANRYSEYIYDQDYELGDLVEVRNRDGVVTYKRVTEQIFVHDKEGEREYPTLSLGVYNLPVTWGSYKMAGASWYDFDTEVWNEM